MGPCGTPDNASCNRGVIIYSDWADSDSRSASHETVSSIIVSNAAFRSELNNTVSVWCWSEFVPLRGTSLSYDRAECCLQLIQTTQICLVVAFSLWDNSLFCLNTDNELLTDFSSPDDKGGIIEELLLILSINHLTSPTTKTTSHRSACAGRYEVAGAVRRWCLRRRSTWHWRRYGVILEGSMVLMSNILKSSSCSQQRSSSHTPSIPSTICSPMCTDINCTSHLQSDTSARLPVFVCLFWGTSRFFHFPLWAPPWTVGSWALSCVNLIGSGCVAAIFFR